MHNAFYKRHLNVMGAKATQAVRAASQIATTGAGNGFYEFFSGSGMVRIGLGQEWNCLFANDFSKAKCASYAANFGGQELVEGDIADIDLALIPKGASLAWASFPCQDLSLAGARNGLDGERSKTFWAFWQHMQALKKQGNKVPIIVLENVVGLLSSCAGADFTKLIETLSADYKVGAIIVDAVHWVPQSRPRLFIIAIAKGIRVPEHLTCIAPRGPWHTQAIQRAFDSLSDALREDWLWWNIPCPPPREAQLRDLIEHSPEMKWNTYEATEKLLNMMSPANIAKVNQVRKSGVEIIGTVYKRTRPSKNGQSEQRAEVRFDGISGCLRTPSGGSSRQTILVVKGDNVRSRLLSAREAARLMGLPESYKLPKNYNDAYRLAGDGVAVPAVDWIQRHVLTPLMEGIKT